MFSILVKILLIIGIIGIIKFLIDLFRFCMGNKKDNVNLNIKITSKKKS